MKTTEIKVTGYESRVTPTGLHDTNITVAIENVTAIVNITTGFSNSYSVTVYSDDNKVASIYADEKRVSYEAEKVTESKSESFSRNKGLHTSIYTGKKMKEYKTVKGFNNALADFDLTLDDIWTLSNAAVDAMIKIRDDENAELDLVDKFISQAVEGDEITADLISKGEIDAKVYFENLTNGDENYIACVDLPTSSEAAVACRVMDKAGLNNDHENCLYEYSCAYTWLNRIELKRDALVKICKAYNRPITFNLYEKEIAEVINQRLIDATDETCTADAVEASVEAMEVANTDTTETNTLKRGFEDMAFAKSLLDQAEKALTHYECKVADVRKNARTYADRSAFERAFNLAVYNRENWIEKRNQRLLAYEERKNFYEGLAAELDGNLDFQLD